ncbi:MAG: type II secretion system protein GspN [Nitrospinota bacterium]
MMWENLKNYLAAPLFYTAVFIASLMLFVINGIDGNAIVPKLESLIEQNSKAAIRIGSARLSLPASLTLTDVTVDDKAGTTLKFDNLTLRPLLLPLFTGSPTLRVVVRTTNGKLDIDLSTAGLDTNLRRIKVRANNFAIQEIVRNAGGNPLPVNGELNGNGDILFPSGAMTLPDSTGSLTISIDNVKINGGALGQALFKNVSPKKASCKIAIKKRMLTTSQCEAETGAGTFDLRVSSQLLKSVAVSPLRGTLVVTPADGPLKRFLTIYPNRRRPDGGYHFPLKGTLTRPGLDL